jgi:hypothetical protein
MLVARISRLRMRRSMCVFILLLALTTMAWLAVRRNLAAIGSDVAGVVLSRALGGADVRVESVTVHGIRSLAMSGVKLGDGLSAQRVLVAYDFRSLLRAHTSPLLSVTAIRAEGVEADWSAFQKYVNGAEPAGATSVDQLRLGSGSGAGSKAGSGGSKGVAAFAGTISIRDAVVKVGRSGETESGKPAERRVELKNVRLEPVAGNLTTAWSVAVANASYYDTQWPGQAVELADVRGVATLSDGAVTADDVSAQLLGGMVRGEFTAASATGTGSAAVRVAGQAILTGVSYNGWAFTGELATCDDGRIRVDGEVSFSGGGNADASGDDSAPGSAIDLGRLNARLDGTAVVPGFTPDATTLSANGIVNIRAMEIGKSRVNDLKLEVSAESTRGAGDSPGDIVISTRAQKATLEQIARALGRPIPAQGWVEWCADGKIGPDGHAYARLRLTDGAVRPEGWPDELPHEFTGISGVIEVSTVIKAPADASASADAPVSDGGSSEGKPALRVPGMHAKLGGGEVGVSGSPQSWRVTASGVRVDHQLVSGLVDADLVLRAGTRLLLSGRAAVRNAQMDLVVAGIQSGVPVPEADLDVDIEVGENVRIVRGESWAWALPGTVHVQGSTRRPIASGSLNLSSGRIDLYGVPLEVVSGGVHFTGAPGDPPEFFLAARDVASGLPTIITVDGVPGDMRITVKPEEGSEKEVREGDLLVKLLLARLRLYMLSGLGQALAN